MNRLSCNGSGPTCGNCAHWHRKPADPNNLGAPAQGECREGPPHATTLPVNNGQGTLTISAYPSLGADFPACGHFRARVVVADA